MCSSDLVVERNGKELGGKIAELLGLCSDCSRGKICDKNACARKMKKVLAEMKKSITERESSDSSSSDPSSSSSSDSSSSDESSSESSSSSRKSKESGELTEESSESEQEITLLEEVDRDTKGDTMTVLMYETKKLAYGRDKKAIDTNLLYDSGHSFSIISPEYAARCGLEGTKKSIVLETLGEDQLIEDSTLYHLTLIFDGRKQSIKLQSAPTNRIKLDAVDTEMTRGIFNEITAENHRQSGGAPDIVIGTD